MKQLLNPQDLTENGGVVQDWKTSKILLEGDMDFLNKCLGRDNMTLKLIYRATRDGDSSVAFWEQCINKENTFTFVKSHY